MTDLSRQQIEVMRSLLCDERWIDDLCDMALAKKDAEQRAQRAEASRDSNRRELHDAWERAERTEAECERLRERNKQLRRVAGLDPVDAPPPESEPCHVCGEKPEDLEWCDGPFDWCPERDAPHTPEQTGGAMAALDELRDCFVNIDWNDRHEQERGSALLEIIRRDLTASGVPQSVWTLPDLWDAIGPPPGVSHADELRRALTASGVSEEVRRLPGRMERQADARNDGDFISDHQRGIADASRHWAKALRKALASAPADGYKLVPVEPTEAMVAAGKEALEYTIAKYPAFTCYCAMIAAAPTDGRE